MHKPLYLLFPLVLALHGCVVAYDAMRTEAENNCKQKVIADRDECMKRLVPHNYDQYERDRQKISNARPSVSNSPP